METGAPCGSDSTGESFEGLVIGYLLGFAAHKRRWLMHTRKMSGDQFVSNPNIQELNPLGTDPDSTQT
ncbi:MAG: hypothetical protein HUU26_02915 [Gemmatimonadaceae bacterium]|nr:hypothetical protein [Gemmatimonadaceae bacterium]